MLEKGRFERLAEPFLYIFFLILRENSEEEWKMGIGKLTLDNEGEKINRKVLEIPNMAASILHALLIRTSA